MNPTGSSTPEKSISSIRTDIGGNTDDALELGRKIADQLEDGDLLGHWIAHHLSELIIAAQNDATITVEQRRQIIETILKVWSHRSRFPNHRPLADFSTVLVALDRLSDESPFAFTRLLDKDLATEVQAWELPVIATAKALENTVRETLTRLLWLAAREAREKNRDWIEAADKVTRDIESEISTSLWRLEKKRSRRRLRDAQHDPRLTLTETISTAADEPSTDETEWTPLTEQRDSITSDMPNDTDDETYASDDELADSQIAQQLRDAADLLTTIADTIDITR